MYIIDALIGNFDRHGNNWGFIKSNNKYYGVVSATLLTIQIFYDKNLPATTGFKAEYYLELEDQTAGEDEYDLIVNYSGEDVKFKLDSCRG